MARLGRPQPSSDDEDGSIGTGNSSNVRTNPSTSPSPAASFSSDKENQSRPSTSSTKRKSTDMAPPGDTTPSAEGSSASKRRKLGGRGRENMLPSQAAHEKALRDNIDKEFYDPDQNEDERRAVRKTLRDLSKNLNDSKAEYLQAASRGIQETIERANAAYKNVKQTADATIDSRLLVTAADLGYKRTAQLALGDASAGVDVDEFVSKCITFMRRGPTNEDADPGASTQRQRRRRRHNDDAELDDDEEDNGDALNWDWLGRQACFPHNGRPSVPSFLLGPLSVEKKVRQQTQRRAREARRNPADATRPEEIEAEDLEKETAATLMTLCANILKLLQDVQVAGQKEAEAAVDEEMGDDEVQEVLWKYNVTDTGGVPLFKFCVNPKSFGQTVENFFYVSFLVKEGKAGLEVDSRNLPSLIRSEAPEGQERKEKGSQRQQAVFKLDYETWENLVEAFELKDSLIPHREEERPQRSAAEGWYA